ncbi:hypothetical protein Clacol_002836 [Clathrus columnatus]|uniref:RRM domain-containing protein n=1 Tax=Clathrus columnatus TaxID=1419009 RepID=A0AAV5A4R2_9AGAM|nr:hypothetical protein Clacol_002836 [Clathrus columnatus]
MTHLLPPNLLKLFAPRPPLPYARPVGKDPDRVRSKNVKGVAAILEQIQEENTAVIIKAGESADATTAGEEREEGEEQTFTYAEETIREIRREKRKKEKEENFKRAKENYKPTEDSEAVGDPYKTLFISRLSKNATENDVRRHFEPFGPLERVRVVRDKKNRSRGYAFLVYERERDMKAAYKEADGMVILGKKILVDVERGRTVRGWKPRRLGGGLGGRPKVEPLVSLAGRGGGSGGGGSMRGGGYEEGEVEVGDSEVAGEEGEEEEEEEEGMAEEEVSVLVVMVSDVIFTDASGDRGGFRGGNFRGGYGADRGGGGRGGGVGGVAAFILIDPSLSVYYTFPKTDVMIDTSGQTVFLPKVNQSFLIWGRVSHSLSLRFQEEKKLARETTESGTQQGKL